MTIKVDVTNVATGQVGWSATFPDSNSANAWITQCESSYAWGKPARTLQADQNGRVIDVDGSIANLTLATSTGTTVNSMGITVNTYTFASDYTVTSTDITAQAAQQAAVQTGLSNQAYGALVIANIFAINDAKLAAGTLTTSQLQAMMQDPTISLIRELLWAGSIATAKALIAAYDTTASGAYFSAADQTAILELLVAY